MKILHIAKFYYPVDGGIESTSKYIVDSLPQFEHQVVCFNTRNNTEIDYVNTIKVTRVATLGKIASQPISISYYRRLKTILKEYSPDIIHLHYPNPLIAFFLVLLMPPRSHNERRSRHPPHTHRRGAQRAGRPGRRRGQRNSRIRQGLRIQKARHAGHLRHHWLC